MIIIKGGSVTLDGDTKGLMAECAKGLYTLINAQANASNAPFTKTAEWMITVITNAVLEANKAAERENT